MRKIACILTVVTGLGLVLCFSTAQEPGKNEKEVNALWSKLKELRKSRLEESEKQLKKLASTVLSKPNLPADAENRFTFDFAKDRLHAIIESTANFDQGREREKLIVPFLALVKEIEAKYKIALEEAGQRYGYLYRALMLEAEIELVKVRYGAKFGGGAGVATPP